MKLIIRIYVFALCCIGGFAQAEALPFAHISTTGYGEVTVVPDCAVFSVQVEKATMNADQAKQGVDEIVTTFIERLQKQGISTQFIRRSHLVLAPQYYYPKEGRPQLVGYRASRRIQVDVTDLSALNDYLDMAIAVGINHIDSIQLKVKDQRRYLQQARLAAIQDATHKAQSLALGFKRSLGAVWAVDYHPHTTENSIVKTLSTNQKLTKDSYQNANITIRDSVDVTFRLN